MSFYERSYLFSILGNILPKERHYAARDTTEEYNKENSTKRHTNLKFLLSNVMCGKKSPSARTSPPPNDKNHSSSSSTTIEKKENRQKSPFGNKSCQAIVRRIMYEVQKGKPDGTPFITSGTASFYVWVLKETERTIRDKYVPIWKLLMKTSGVKTLSGRTVVGANELEKLFSTIPSPKDNSE